MVPPVTAREKLQLPESPSESESVPEIEYGDPLTGSVPVVEMTPVEGSIAISGLVVTSLNVTGALFPLTATVVW
jgi:hypothetical protein